MVNYRGLWRAGCKAGLLFCLGAPGPAAMGQEIVPCGGGSYASYAPWRLARSTRHWGDQSRIMQTRPVYMTSRRAGEPLPTNDWWTDALVSRWTGNLWSYPAKVRVGADGVRVAYPEYWIDDGTEVKERSALTIGANGAFAPHDARVDDWHDWDVSIMLEDGEKKIRATLVHGSPFTWIEGENVELKVSVENDSGLPVKREKRGGGELIEIGGAAYGVWRGKGWVAIGLLPAPGAFDALAPYATAIIRSTRVDWRYDEKTATVKTTWNVETEDLAGRSAAPVALQGFQPHHLKRTRPHFATMEGLAWLTPRGRQRVAAGNSLEIDYAFPGMLPYWAAPSKDGSPLYDGSLFAWLVGEYAQKGTFGGDTYWGGKGLLQMAFAMMAARETGDEAAYAAAHAKLRSKFEDWLTWEPGEEKFFFSYVPRWGGLVGEGTSYDSDAFNDHHFHYGYFTYAGALLCMVDDGFREKYGPMLRLVARDYANWKREGKGGLFPFMRTFDPWAGHSFAGGVGDGNGNGQESSSEAMQGWGGLYLLGLALGDTEMRDAGIFGWAIEARATAEYWFDRDRENIDYSKFRHPYNSNLTCHGVGWWTYFSGDPVWMHSIQWLPNTPALDYLSEDLAFAEWDWRQMWEKKEIGGWFEKGRDRNGNTTDCVGDASLGNVLLSYLQRHDPAGAAEIFAKLREKGLGAANNVDTAHMTYWAVHSHLTWGELDFGVRADYPCARAFIKDGKRSLMVYNAGPEPRRVTFFDAKSGEIAGAVDAPPRRLAVSTRGARGSAANMRAVETPVSAYDAGWPEDRRRRLVPPGVAMPDLALGRPVVVSSQENAGMPGSNMTDGDETTRWSSAHDETELTAAVDLGETVSLYGAELKWENSYASRYLFEVSADGTVWKPIGGERAGAEGLQRLDFAGEKARWVRVRGLEKATQYGISLYRFSVYGRPAGAQEALGMRIEADKAVLKQGEPCKVSASLWMGGDKFVAADPEWSSDDGTFGKRGFTPAKDGFATVTARLGRLEVSRRLPVEEALQVSALMFSPTNAVAIAGEPVKISLTATDQFGSRMAAKGLSLDVVTPGGKKAKATDYIKKGGLFAAAKPGLYRLRAEAGGVAAESTVSVMAPGEVNLARLATVSASGEENGALGPERAADGDGATRWSSRHRDGEWISFDFGRQREVSRVVVDWERACAEKYIVEISPDGERWQTVAEAAHCSGGRMTHDFRPVKAKSLRITGLERNTDYGISIFETDIR